MVEKWVSIEGFEGQYEVSSLGNVRSLDRLTHQENRWGVVTAFRTPGKRLKQKLDKYGYPVVCIMKNQKRRYATIHRLVAENFIPNPGELPQVNHRDGDKQNNKPDNLEWCSAQQNIRHSVISGLNKAAKGTRLPQTKLNEKSVIKVRELIGEGYLTYAQIGERFGVSGNCVYHIAKRDTWGWLT